MRKVISKVYSKAFPKKDGEDYTAKELLIRLVIGILLVAILFFLSKYFYDRFHLE